MARGHYSLRRPERSVIELKRVVFPAFVFPMIPILMTIWTPLGRRLYRDKNKFPMGYGEGADLQALCASYQKIMAARARKPVNQSTIGT